MLITRLISTLFFLLIVYQIKGQNLVPNASFENLIHIPCSEVPYDYEFNDLIEDWTLPTSGSSDVYSMLSASNCFANCQSSSNTSLGSQLPHTGNNMCGFVAYIRQGLYREYLQIQLTKPLTVGNEYYAEIYISLADKGGVGSNNIGMYFSDTIVTSTQPYYDNLPFQPQVKSSSILSDTINWVKISGTFTAAYSANYLIIGNFDNDLNTSTIHINNGRPPNTAYYYIDDVLVEEKASCQNTEIPNLITPNGDGLNDTFNIGCLGDGRYEINVFNSWGAIVYANKSYLNDWGGHNLSNGIYFYELKKDDQSIYRGWVHVLK